MYTIIYWINGELLMPYICKNGQLQLFDKLADADAVAELIEKVTFDMSQHVNTDVILYNYILDEDDELEARVITISGIHNE